MPKPHSGRGTLVLNALVPVALYYGLRAVGASVYLALLAGAVVPAVTTAAGVIRSRTIDRLGAFMLSTMLFGVAVALVAGSPRFLLAKEAWVTAAVGVWFMLSARGSRPLSFEFARAMLEGRHPFTDQPWDELWERSPAFRRGWRTSSVIWGIGCLVDAAVRVVLAYSLPVDLVPALTPAVFVASFVILALIDQINYPRTGLRRLLLADGLGQPAPAQT
ncbi:MAG: VC0807 family protein [Solirubrobacteraceae bacterium]